MPKQYIWTAKLPEELMYMMWEFYFTRHVLIELRLNTIGLKYSIAQESAMEERLKNKWGTNRIEADCGEEIRMDQVKYTKAKNRAWTLEYNYNSGRILTCQCPQCVITRIVRRKLNKRFCIL